jgi:RimJ/RimL family protein N-acetyltransferase
MPVRPVRISAVTAFLETERLVLRRFTVADADLLVELDSDPEVMRYLNGGRPTSRARVENTVLPGVIEDYTRYPGYGVFPAFTRVSGEFVGWFELVRDQATPPDEAELGYRLRRAVWDRGYATEGGRELLRHGFEVLGLRRVVAETMTVNAGSRRVMEKLGLRYELTYFPPFAPIPGSEHGEVRYTLDRAGWAASRRKNLHSLS